MSTIVEIIKVNRLHWIALLVLIGIIILTSGILWFKSEFYPSYNTCQEARDAIIDNMPSFMQKNTYDEIERLCGDRRY